MSTSSLKTLKTNIQGNVTTPADPSYNTLKDGFMHKGSPAVIVQVKDAKDIQYVLAYAKEQHLALSVRSGGHSQYSTNNGGIVIDLSLINTIEQTGQSTVKIGAGATWREVASRLHDWGLAISSGDTTSVGVGGLTTGGGIGWMVRKYGLAIDHLIAAHIVTADGKEYRVSTAENEDLFWAIRGGGGNFGIVTHFEFQAHENHGVFAGTITYDRTDMESILKQWRNYMREAPEELTVIINILPAFGEGTSPILAISFCYAGTNEAEAMRTINPLLGFGTVISKDISKKAYKDVLEEAHPPAGVRVLGNNMLVNDFSDIAIEVIAREGLAHNLILQIRGLGGAMGRIDPLATAFAGRGAEVLVVSPIFVSPQASQEEIERSLTPWYTISTFSDGAYANLLTDATEQAKLSAYPEPTLRRLVAIKAQYDPQNIFNQNLNVAPRRNA